jgi:hypothetical protein
MLESEQSVQVVRAAGSFEVPGQVPQAVTIKLRSLPRVEQGAQARVQATPAAKEDVANPSVGLPRGLSQFLDEGPLRMSQYTLINSAGEKVPQAGMIEAIGPS